MPHRNYDIMGLLHLCSRILFLLTAVRTTDSTFSATEKDIIHAIAGNPFIIRAWSMVDSTLYITIKKDNTQILDISVGIGIDMNSTVQKDRMIPIYNQTTKELSVLFKNISKEDGGIYEMKESFYRTNTTLDETESDTYDGRWFLEIYVLEPDEIKKGYVGENISMEFEKSIEQSTLYNYDEYGALLAGSTCSVLTESYLYGRIGCSNDDSGSMYKINIANVSQRDAGLYKVTTGKKETGIYLFEIKDSPICAVVGDSLTIGWFYNQQGKQRTLRVIHPNQGIMMLLHQSNSPQIKKLFQHRIQYSGDTLQSFMLFTLLNVSLSDAGLYTIETLHGNTIPGSKELNVEGACDTGGFIKTTFHDVRNNISASELEVPDQPTDGQYLAISIVAPVFTVAVVVSITILSMTWCLIWIQRRNSYQLEAGKRLETLVSSLTLSNDLRHQLNSYSPSESGVVDTTLYSTFCQPDMENDNHGASCIADHNGLRTMNDGEILIACIKHSDKVNLDSSPSVYSLAKAAAGLEYAYTDIVEGMGARHESHNIQPFHGKDTVTRITDGLCKNEYEMMDIEVAFDPNKTFEDYSGCFESTKYQTPLYHEQRRVHEQGETAFVVTHTSIRIPPYMPPSKDTWTHGQVPERKAFSIAVLSLSSTAISIVSASLDKSWCITDSLSEPDDDKPSVYCVTNPNYTIGWTDDNTLVSCTSAAYAGVLNSCAPTRTMGSAAEYEEQIYKCIRNGNSSSEVFNLCTRKSRKDQTLNLATIDNCVAMEGTESPLCWTEYNMVNISTDFEQKKTLQDYRDKGVMTNTDGMPKGNKDDPDHLY